MEGGFPVLGASGSNPHLPAPEPQAYKVMSLTGGKHKKVTVSSYTNKPKATPASSLAPSRAESPEVDEGPARVPPPPEDVIVPSVSVKQTRDRPWMNAREKLEYVEPPRL